MECITRLFVLSFSIVFLYVDPSWGVVFKTIPQALSDVRPFELEVEKNTLFLNQQEVKSLEAKLDTSLSSKMIGRIFLWDGQHKKIATAYIDTHKVRKETQTIMIIVGIDGVVEKIEILSFNEPPGYEASDTWLKQFKGLERKKIMSKYATALPESGSTLTSDAIVKALQKIVAIDQLSR